MEGSESEVKLMAFMIDQKLAWREHVQEIGKRLTRVFFLLRKLKNHLTEKYLVTANYILFHSLLSYGLILCGWAASCKKS